jgi:hypothetical protein
MAGGMAVTRHKTLLFHANLWSAHKTPQAVLADVFPVCLRRAAYFTSMSKQGVIGMTVRFAMAGL